MKVEYFLMLYTKVNSKWKIKLLEENIGSILFDINHSKILHNPPPRIMKIKTKINKWDLTKLTSFCIA